MAKRHKMSSRHSKRSFTKHASKTHRRNVPTAGAAGHVGPMRGGIRI